jgi:hypothetical protein
MVLLPVIGVADGVAGAVVVVVDWAKAEADSSVAAAMSDRRMRIFDPPLR